MSATSNFSYAQGYAFDWMENPEWNDPALRSPIPCKAGANCTYSGVCSFVHPGEEGAGRRLFPARTAEEKDMVRLFHPDRRPDYYTRRIHRLSWPEWCARQGLPVPVLKKAEKPLGGAAPSGRRKERIVLAENTSNVVQTYTVTMPIYQLPAPTPITLEQLMAVQPSHKEMLGTQIFTRVDAIFQNPACIAELQKVGWYVPSCTAGKIVGMMMDAATEEQLEIIRDDEAQMFDIIIDCCQTLVEAAA